MTIKSKLPVSSRSFHFFEGDVSKKLDGVLECLNEQKRVYDATMDKLVALENEQMILKEQLYYYAEAMMKEGTNNTHEARKKLFKNLPENSDQKIRLCQLSNAKLMFELDKILRKNKIDYWASYGTLVGALTRNAPMPWDDDMDICMTRENLKKLISVLAKDNSFQITIIYDWYVKCIQYRFCSRNVKIPSFVDITPWDYGRERTLDAESRLREIREEMIDAFDKAKLDYWDEIKVLPEPGSGFMRQIMDDAKKEDYGDLNSKRLSEEAKKIKKIFEEYRQKAENEGLLVKRENAKTIVYGVDNMLMTKNRRLMYEKEMIFPTKRIKYEEFTISCPNDGEEYLNTCYKDWPFLPNDERLLIRYHFNPLILDDSEIQNAMRDFVGIPRLR